MTENYLFPHKYPIDEFAKIPSRKPFVVLFYGSRQRGDFQPTSDSNFYLIASSEDQILANFIQSIYSALSHIKIDGKINLVASDTETFKQRIKMFEPTAIHICEFGEVVYGIKEYKQIISFYEPIRKQNISTHTVLGYLNKRYKFYKSLETKSIKEDIVRIEKVISLNLQIWLFTNIRDLSITEIAFMDIPNRLLKMIKELYKNDITKDVSMLASIYEDIHEFKHTSKASLPFTEEQMNRIKDSMEQIQDFHQFTGFLK